MKILVEYNGSYYYWVDSVVMRDEYDYTCAVLVSSTGSAFAICISQITVVDDTYDYEKERQKQIDQLKRMNSQLRLQMELDAQLAKLPGPIAEVKR